MKIRYKYIKENKILFFDWNDNQKKINLEKEEDVDLNDLYDYIINNINEIEFVDETIENDRDKSLTYQAFQEIIQAIKNETKKIKEKYKEINFL